MPKISLVVPCYNEESNVMPFYEAIERLFSEPGILSDDGARYELVFVNDGSRDGTAEKISALCTNGNGGGYKHGMVRGIFFSRNFGKEAALFAGLRNATGDCAVVLDADLQHPVSLIPEMYAAWKSGFEVVEGVKSDRGKESVFHRLFTKVFYGLISRAVGMDMRNASDYKLLDKKVVAELAALRERNTFFRALSFWVGFKKTTVYYEVAERASGTSKWSTKSLIRYAINNVVCFSYAPLFIVGIIGAAFALFGIVLVIDTVIAFIRGASADGFPTLLIVMLLGFGGVMISLGIIGVYIAQIYDEVKGRPQYIVSGEAGGEDDAGRA
ncbi:MAG: glycosyltransferase family 2 protein [Treponema sp.]|nr:glycosyltransferase family 2 protein [Treponema sp.]